LNWVSIQLKFWNKCKTSKEWSIISWNFRTDESKSIDLRFDIKSKSSKKWTFIIKVMGFKIMNGRIGWDWDSSDSTNQTNEISIGW